MNRLLALLALICLGGVPAFSQGTIITLRPGDTFEMRLGGVPPELAVDFNITYMVSQEGFVNMPLIGKMRAGGLTQPLSAFADIQREAGQSELVRQDQRQMVY